MSEYDSRAKMEALRDHFETFSKGANYLLVAHSAGLAGCLTVVKERPQLEAPFQKVGLLILVFGGGLLFSSIFWATSMMIKVRVTQSIISQERPKKWTFYWVRGKLLEWLALTGLGVGWLLFALANLPQRMPPTASGH